MFLQGATSSSFPRCCTIRKDSIAPMIPQQSVRRVASDDPTLQASPGDLPVAEFVTEVQDQPIPEQPQQGSDDCTIQVVDVVPDYTDDGFSTPSARSFVTEENQVANSNLRAAPNTITGDELLFRLKQHRKKATMRSGVIGGVIGMIFLGPIGALGVGAGSAIFTKCKLKRKEKSLRLQLQGRLDEPLRVFSSVHTHCYHSQG
ncbi:expressed unknown protein [Seminavis robusta]|uniref:Uncharacterized protein n=1 Tax=Seminavis robusta TaxID=568900 RepID=A0A9N8DM32_9STRA|nr:expressed unknown protein [Seminavis robusta]|eukprot:Sro156_g070840.1 n/a (203) ;mRNA; r:54945-55553